jgi:prephenate dehydrogenase
MNTNSEVIGVVGSSGDLGSQLVEMLRNSGAQVMLSDIADKNEYEIGELFENCSIIHFCIPLNTAIQIERLSNRCIIVLHDSVMNSSKDFNNKYLDGQGSIVHMLLNDHNRVIVESGTPHQESLVKHLASIGLRPAFMSVDEHDLLMARSQAPLALLHEVLSKDLAEYAENDMLTPSGLVLVQTLRDRAIAWTPNTMQSLLRNPQLQVLLDEMQAKLSE